VKRWRKRKKKKKKKKKKKRMRMRRNSSLEVWVADSFLIFSISSVLKTCPVVCYGRSDLIWIGTGIGVGIGTGTWSETEMTEIAIGNEIS
jgi:hypothetical protein